MATTLDTLRSELQGKLEPPVDVMIDPSLVVSSSGLDRLSGSSLFEAKTQATLGKSFAKPRIDGLYTPSHFQHLLTESTQIDLQTTATWNFYRGQAKGTTPETIVELFDTHGVQPFDTHTKERLPWDTALDESTRSDRLTATLDEIHAFLADGGLLLSRSASSLDALRDAGVASIDLGRAKLNAKVVESLSDLGYQNPAPLCAFGIGETSGVARSLVGDLLATHSDVVLYRFGK